MGEIQKEVEKINIDDEDEKDRLGFVRKVYGILLVQLLITVGCVFAV